MLLKSSVVGEWLTALHRSWAHRDREAPVCPECVQGCHFKINSRAAHSWNSTINMWLSIWFKGLVGFCLICLKCNSIERRTINIQHYSLINNTLQYRITSVCGCSDEFLKTSFPDQYIYSCASLITDLPHTQKWQLQQSHQETLQRHVVSHFVCILFHFDNSLDMAENILYLSQCHPVMDPDVSKF